jgi:hypothetical protein
MDRGSPSIPNGIRGTSRLIIAGVDVKQVQHSLGYSRASVTLDMYTNLLPGADGEMATRLERLLE